MEPNSMYFSAEMVKAGEMTKFIDQLNALSYGKGSFYNDIHIKPEDAGAFVVEWVQVPWDHAYGGYFVFVGDDECVCSVDDTDE